jgi:hypothetical protein
MSCKIGWSMEIEEKKAAKRALWNKMTEAFQRLSKSSSKLVTQQSGEYTASPGQMSCLRSSSALKWSLLVVVCLATMAAGAYVVLALQNRKQETEAEYGVGDNQMFHIAYIVTP